MLKLASRTQRDVKAKAVLHAIPNKNTFGDKLRQPEELLMISTPNVPISTPTQPVSVKAVPKNNTDSTADTGASHLAKPAPIA